MYYVHIMRGKGEIKIIKILLYKTLGTSVINSPVSEYILIKQVKVC